MAVEAVDSRHYLEDFGAKRICSAVNSSSELEASVAGDRLSNFPFPSMAVAVEEVAVSLNSCLQIQKEGDCVRKNIAGNCSHLEVGLPFGHRRTRTLQDIAAK